MRTLTKWTTKPLVPKLLLFVLQRCSFTDTKSNSDSKSEENTKHGNTNAELSKQFWQCRHTWSKSAYNTMWCLIGCSIGDFGTIYLANAFFVSFAVTHPMFIMGAATVNGLLTSIGLETIILYKFNQENQLTLKQALSTAMGMSLISMISMETAMNITDFLIIGQASVTFYSMIPSMLAGFLVPWPYNYWRLKKYGKACH